MSKGDVGAGDLAVSGIQGGMGDGAPGEDPKRFAVESTGLAAVSVSFAGVANSARVLAGTAPGLAVSSLQQPAPLRVAP